MDDEALWSHFHAGTLPQSEWTHTAHLRVAWMHLRRYELDHAHILARVGIIKLNAVHGLVETPTRGYHETITRAWLVILSGAIREAPSIDDSRRFLEAHGDAFTKGALLSHYSSERLQSARARAVFVEPDLAPLPG
jgi:hypothetical protein